ncbi:MAG TPA: hypothetical protein VF457_15740 [Burkholderiaceae bacterium]
MDDATLIDRHGGPSELARKLGYDKPGSTQRVFNWKARNRIPADVKLGRLDLFGPEAVRAFENVPHPLRRRDDPRPAQAAEGA